MRADSPIEFARFVAAHPVIRFCPRFSTQSPIRWSLGPKSESHRPCTTARATESSTQASLQSSEKGVILISGRKARVLVIDDDSSVADTLAMVLNASGFDATAAYSGETALELARLMAFDNVVADVMMEPMNGIQTALAISHIHPDCQVLLISGNERTSQLLQDAIDAGHAFTILAKPVYPTVIINYLRGAVAPVADICRGGLPE